MAAPARRRVQAREQRPSARTFRLLPGGQPRGARPAPRATRYAFKRVGPIQRASNTQYNFTIRTLKNTQTGQKQVLIGRTHKQTRQTDWRMMSIIEYNTKHASRKPKGEGKIQLLTTSATMLAKHPDMFTQLGHEIGKNIIHFLMAA